TTSSMSFGRSFWGTSGSLMASPLVDRCTTRVTPAESRVTEACRRVVGLVSDRPGVSLGSAGDGAVEQVSEYGQQAGSGRKRGPHQRPDHRCAQDADGPARHQTPSTHAWRHALTVRLRRAPLGHPARRVTRHFTASAALHSASIDGADAAGAKTQDAVVRPRMRHSSQRPDAGTATSTSTMIALCPKSYTIGTSGFAI